MELKKHLLNKHRRIGVSILIHLKRKVPEVTIKKEESETEEHDIPKLKDEFKTIMEEMLTDRPESINRVSEIMIQNGYQIVRK